MSSEELTGKNYARGIVCPFCHSADNELFSLFGQTLIGTQYYCRNCHTVFEAVRWESETSEVFRNLIGLTSDEEKDDDGL
jgi:hypothetical protein